MNCLGESDFNYWMKQFLIKVLTLQLNSRLPRSLSPWEPEGLHQENRDNDGWRCYEPEMELEGGPIEATTFPSFFNFLNTSMQIILFFCLYICFL